MSAFHSSSMNREPDPPYQRGTQSARNVFHPLLSRAPSQLPSALGHFNQAPFSLFDITLLEVSSFRGQGVA
jgi:hypothetical protein